METAATKAAQFIATNFSASKKVVVLAGFGNNGGDGLVVARLLAAKHRKVAVLGWQLEKAKAPEAIKAAKKLAGSQAIKPTPLSLDSFKTHIASGAVVVDALFGIGFYGKLPLELASIARLCEEARSKVKVVALDCPSGGGAGESSSGGSGKNSGWGSGEKAGGYSGKASGGGSGGEFSPGKNPVEGSSDPQAGFTADHTLAFAAAQPSHYLQPHRTGKLKVIDIGIPEGFWQQVKPKYALNHPFLWQGWFKPLTRQSHKYSRGSVLVSGGDQMSGAARLAGYAALKCVSGASTIAVPAKAMALYAATPPEVILRTYKTASQWQKLCQPKNIDSIVVGCGGGTQATRLASIALATKKPIVVDGDAIQPQLSLHQNAVWTPHLGEFRRICPALSSKSPFISNPQMLETLPQAIPAKFKQATLVLKGSTTLIHWGGVHWGGDQFILNADAPPQLATAGSGDVLSGVIGSLLAGGFVPPLAAAAGVWLHAKAAELLGLGLTASQLSQALPQAVNEATNCRL